MRCAKQPSNQGVVEGIGQKMSHIPAHADEPVYGRSFLIGEIAHGAYGCTP
jgi:hypothetical protein